MLYNEFNFNIDGKRERCYPRLGNRIQANSRLQLLRSHSFNYARNIILKVSVIAHLEKKLEQIQSTKLK